MATVAIRSSHRFREADEPLTAIAVFLRGVHGEALARGYAFDQRLIEADGMHPQIPTARSQLLFEASHLRAKLNRRSPALASRLDIRRPIAHPLFRIVPGNVEGWERAGGVAALSPSRPEERGVDSLA